MSIDKWSLLIGLSIGLIAPVIIVIFARIGYWFCEKIRDHIIDKETGLIEENIRLQARIKELEGQDDNNNQ